MLPGEESTAGGFACTGCGANFYNPDGSTVEKCRLCPEHSEPSVDSAFCRCKQGYYYDNWTPPPGRQGCKELPPDTIWRRRTVAGQPWMEVVTIGGIGGAPAETAKGSWIHVESMGGVDAEGKPAWKPLHCLPGNCVSCDDDAGVPPAMQAQLESDPTAPTGIGPQVRKTPSWPRSWANFSLLQLYSHRNAWANLHLLGQPGTFSLQVFVESMSRGGEMKLSRVDCPGPARGG